MTENISAHSFNDLVLNQDEFQMREEAQENNKIYRVKNYINSQFRTKFSKSCHIISICAAIFFITIITIIIMRDNHSDTKIVEIFKDNIQKVLVNCTINKKENLSRHHNDEVIEVLKQAKNIQNRSIDYTSKNEPDYFLQEVLLWDTNKLWLLNLQNKSSILFHESASNIDTFNVFTKEQFFISVFQLESTTIYASFDHENTSNKISSNPIFDEFRFRSRAMAYDYIGQNLYAVDETTGALLVLDVNTKLYNLLVTDLIQPTNIYLDSLEGLMFILQDSHSILKGDMNGGNLNTIIHGTGLTAMALDCQNKRIYWVNDYVDIESSNYNGENCKKFSINTATIIDLLILDNKLFWISQNYQNSTMHHLVYCQINGQYCENHEVHLLDNFGNLKGIRSIRRLGPKASKLKPHPCEVENGGCEQLCLSSSGKSHSCVCKLGWQLSPDKRTCQEVSNFLLYMSKNLIRGHMLDVTGTTLTDVILPTLYRVPENSTVASDYDQIHDHFYFSDGYNVYRIKLKENKYQPRLTVLRNPSGTIMDIAIDWLTGNLYVYSSHNWGSDQFDIRTYYLDLDEMILEDTQTFQSFHEIKSGINIHPKQHSIFFPILSRPDYSYNDRAFEIWMDHYDVQSLTSTTIKLPRTVASLKRPVAIDYEENKLYWIDEWPSVIVKFSSFGGRDVKKIMVDDVGNASYIFIYRQWIYLADEENVWRIHKKTGRGAVKLLSKSGPIADMKLISLST